jgi:hypothetical protein
MASVIHRINTGLRHFQLSHLLPKNPTSATPEDRTTADNGDNSDKTQPPAMASVVQTLNTALLTFSLLD